MIRSSKSGPVGAPFFPNLVQEGKLGYDVRIEMPAIPIILQFKIPEILKTSAAREISKLALPGISSPFFRMPMMKKNRYNQHNALVKIEKDLPGSVYYATPCLDNNEAFHNSYDNVNVHLDTAYFSPREIGKINDNQKHSIAYMKNSNFGWFCSDPKRIKIHKFNEFSESAHEKFQEKRFMGFFESISLVDRVIRDSWQESIYRLDDDADDDVIERIEFETTPQLMTDDLGPDVRHLIDMLEFARIRLGSEVIISQPRQ